MGDHDEVEILLVEDNPTDAELAMRALRKGNIANRATWLKDGAQAIDFIFCKGEYANRLPCTQPKLILLDLYLPRREDGWRLLGWFKNKDGALHRIPVVVLSNSTDQADVRTAYEQGVTSFLIKPLDYDHWLDYFRTLKQYWWDTVTLPDSRS